MSFAFADGRADINIVADYLYPFHVFSCLPHISFQSVYQDRCLRPKGVTLYKWGFVLEQEKMLGHRFGAERMLSI